ncbi:hypothetical protein L484_022628 [Morus notabilis]|uniref:Uncharacterized protein n=1 Tax=Morus notabilis TaxID=981085 RepID=W9RX62_9ROSA|nr:hypothetical protein L484_022628 [Morus notabilis]
MLDRKVESRLNKPEAAHNHCNKPMLRLHVSQLNHLVYVSCCYGLSSFYQNNGQSSTSVSNSACVRSV